jgi:23S rRNA pseudouridine2605 synthase
MTIKKKAKSAAPAAKPAPKIKKTDAASKKRAAKSKAAGPKSAKSAAKSPAPAKKRATPARKTPALAKAPAAKSRKRTAKVKQESAIRLNQPVLDPIGDVTSGEAHRYLGGADLQAQQKQAQVEIDAFKEETNIEASDVVLEAGPGMEAAQAATEERARQEAEDKAQAETDIEADDEAEPADKPVKPQPAKLERLQKILSAAGIASRRRAEEMIVAGRVMVNGQVVTQLGSKADLGRDHIRVDGKLLHGAERHRYFMLNKPRGYVTTVSDPEHRPTVMEFFAKSKERVYPVGRLDYLSEGLLLMTNDGELANLLSKAGSGVEKTYLVKVAGQPSADELERLRGGVTIEKSEPGSARVRTAPARVREFREGDNPWFEVVLIEGRNRELRKMFAAIGHFAEKIRRVGYGPLVLDVEPGNMRELTEDEVNALRLTAEGKMKPRHIKVAKMLPKEAGLSAEKREQRRDRKFDRRFDRRPDPGFDRRPSRSFDRPPGRPGGPVGRDDRRPQSQGARSEKPRWKQEERGPKREWQPRSEGFRGEQKSRPEFRSAPRPEFRPGPRQERGGNRFGNAPRAPFKSDRQEFRPTPRQERGENRFGNAPRAPFKPRSERPQWKRDSETKPRGEFAKPLEGQRSTGFQKGPGVGGGKPKPSFGGKPAFRGKPGSSSKPRWAGKSRSPGGGGAKRGFSRPGAQRGGWSRGSTRKPQS